MRRVGLIGEKVAVKFLKSKGYKIYRLNYQKRVGEIDIIALDLKKVLIFFEVKTRTSNSYGHPHEAVDEMKQKKLIQTMDFFLQENPVFLNNEYRFDVLSIWLNLHKKEAKIEHIKNAIEDIE